MAHDKDLVVVNVETVAFQLSHCGLDGAKAPTRNCFVHPRRGLSRR